MNPALSWLKMATFPSISFLQVYYQQTFPLWKSNQQWSTKTVENVKYIQVQTFINVLRWINLIVLGSIINYVIVLSGRDQFCNVKNVTWEEGVLKWCDIICERPLGKIFHLFLYEMPSGLIDSTSDKFKSFKPMVCIRDLDKLNFIWRFDFRLELIFNTAPAASKNIAHFKRG